MPMTGTSSTPRSTRPTKAGNVSSFARSPVGPKMTSASARASSAVMVIAPSVRCPPHRQVLVAEPAPKPLAGPGRSSRRTEKWLIGSARTTRSLPFRDGQLCGTTRAWGCVIPGTPSIFRTCRIGPMSSSWAAAPVTRPRRQGPGRIAGAGRAMTVRIRRLRDHGVVSRYRPRPRVSTLWARPDRTRSVMGMVQDPCPVQFSVDYPDRPLYRLTTFFRIFTVIPIAIVLGTVSGGTWGSSEGRYYIVGAGGLLVLGPLLMILFRLKYPRWWFDWNLELQRFSNRVGVYVALMDDTYPSTDEHQSVYLDYRYPDVPVELNRFLPLVKWLLAIPHYIALAFLHIGAVVAVIVAWFAILFTGRYPRGIFDYVEGVIRWNNRVLGYAFVLITDRYPPFRLRP